MMKKLAFYALTCLSINVAAYSSNNDDIDKGNWSRTFRLQNGTVITHEPNGVTLDIPGGGTMRGGKGLNIYGKKLETRMSLNTFRQAVQLWGIIASEQALNPVGNNNINNNNNLAAPIYQAQPPIQVPAPTAMTQQQMVQMRARYGLAVDYNLNGIPSTFDPAEYLAANPEVRQYAEGKGLDTIQWAFRHARDMRSGKPFTRAEKNARKK